MDDIQIVFEVFQGVNNAARYPREDILVSNTYVHGYQFIHASPIHLRDQRDGVSGWTYSMQMKTQDSVKKAP